MADRRHFCRRIASTLRILSVRKALPEHGVRPKCLFAVARLSGSQGSSILNFQKAGENQPLRKQAFSGKRLVRGNVCQSGLDAIDRDAHNSKWFTSNMGSSAMHRLITLITAVHVLAHSVLGCCSHHSHRLSSANESSASHCCTPGHGHSCEHHQTHDDGCLTSDENSDTGVAACSERGLESSPQSQHRCSHSSCHWVVSKASAAMTLVSLECATPFCAVYNTSVCCSKSAVCALKHGRANFSAPPLRTHLAVCVLII